MLTKIRVNSSALNISELSDDQVSEEIENAGNLFLSSLDERDTLMGMQTTTASYVEDDGSTWILVTFIISYQEFVTPRPDLGTGRAKVTQDVFDYIKLQVSKNHSDQEIADEFDGGISVSTVSKVRRSWNLAEYLDRS